MQQTLLSSIDIETQSEPEPPPPEPEPKAEEPAPVPEKAPPPVAKAEPPPAAAQAGQVLTAKADPNEPIDLTGMTFVTGTGDTYAGGVTASNGTSKDAVHDRNASTKGVVGGTGAAPVVDRSAPASLASSTQWQCPFPEEADIEQINYARVTVTVSVQVDGRAKSVQVIKDPGFGFANAARVCALRQAYRPALDRDGKPIAQTLGPMNITFQR
jgi:protein TonB